MEKEKPDKQYEPSYESFTIVPDFFYRKLIKVMGAIPSLVYLTLLSYCNKKKYMAWPSLNTLAKEMGLAKTTIIRNINILIKLKVIKNVARVKSDKNYYHHNVYQLLPPEKILLSLLEAKDNSGGGSDTLLVGFQKATSDSSATIPQVVAERYPKHNNLKHNHITTTNKDAAVVDFKKIKEEGEERMMVIRKRMLALDFKAELIEKILKDFSTKKIEEKLDLLMERRNIHSPAGWLIAALKNDYQDVEREKYEEEPKEGSSNLINTAEWTSREKALEAIKLIQDNLFSCKSPLPSRKRTGVIVNQKLIQERRFKCPN